MKGRRIAGLPHRIKNCLALLLSSAAFLIVPCAATISAIAQTPDTKTDTRESQPAEIQRIDIVLARELQNLPPPLSLLDFPPKDRGIAGAELAIRDNNTTGRFLKQEFSLEVVEAPSTEELVSKVIERVKAGARFVVADARAETVLALSDALRDETALIFNAGASDDNLREENCRRNVLHTAPSRAMLTDALAQYLVWKRWRNWFLVHGTRPEDLAYAEALKRSAKRFGAKIVEERPFNVDLGNRRADGGHEQIQQQIPTFTQNAPDYDVLIVADELDQFGSYLPFRTWEARPVAGTQGLVPESWHPSLEQWGATQLQSRFQKLANRPMSPRDYDIWVAVRSIGEAATRTRTNDPEKLIAYIKSPGFDVAGFKGRKLSFRAWNGQLRQPILVSTAKLPVTVSPQPGFLHQFTDLDTLGVDQPETKCRNYAG
ncbi:MAG: branched-chain amino acid ABC transporter substrate-binding protein [Proteobacteria bacterium]|jgi:ABC transporter, substrate binding protein, PQQ-dependent alcohol dehydrogenase system|nr:MAG: branched-chain amino acid ABC transporter substrate-binding protein [Pseudomonadota bacterium]